MDTEVNNYDELFEILKESVKGGVDIVQLRDKRGKDKDIINFSQKVLKTFKQKVLYIINDRVDLVMASGADGVHLGQDDLDAQTARKIIGPNALIGKSCQNIKHLQEAQAQSIDYIGFGSIFKTLTKPQRQPMDFKLLKKVLITTQIPTFVIGGIDLNNLDSLLNMGVRRVAVCRAICQSKDILNTVKQLKRKLAV